MADNPMSSAKMQMYFSRVRRDRAVAQSTAPAPARSVVWASRHVWHVFNKYSPLLTLCWRVLFWCSVAELTNSLLVVQTTLQCTATRTCPACRWCRQLSWARLCQAAARKRFGAGCQSSEKTHRHVTTPTGGFGQLSVYFQQLKKAPVGWEWCFCSSFVQKACEQFPADGASFHHLPLGKDRAGLPRRFSTHSDYFRDSATGADRWAEGRRLRFACSVHFVNWFRSQDVEIIPLQLY